MKSEFNPEVVEAEMRRRGVWSQMANSSLPCKTLVGQGSVFYLQDNPPLSCWFEFGPGEEKEMERIATRCMNGADGKGAPLIKFGAIQPQAEQS